MPNTTPLLLAPLGIAAVKPVRTRLQRKPHLLALEQRFMYDGAAVSSAAHAAGEAALLAQIAAVPAAIEVRPATPSLTDGKNEVVIVDTSLSNYQTLEAGIPAGMGIVEINGTQNGLAQIAQWAATQSGIDAIYILSHGNEGQLELGTTTLTDSSLANPLVQAELAEVGHALNPGGDLLIYGCNVAEGSNGSHFVNDLATDTGAIVAANTQATGAAALGGDWTLNYRTGAITATALNLSNYQGLLSSTTFAFGTGDSGTVTGSGTDTVTETIGSNELTVTGATEPIDVDTVANIVDLPLTDVSQSANVAETGDGALYYETQVTFGMGGTQAFNMNSIIVIDTGQGGGSVTLTTSKGSESFAINTANDTIINLASSADASYFQGVTSVVLTSPGNITSGTANGQFVFAFDDISVTPTVAAPTTTVTSAALSNDTGSSSSDFITNVANQTISGNLSANLAAGESVQVSYDDGATWSNATSYTVGSDTWSTVTTLSGSNTFEARVTNSGGSSTAYTHTYDLDTTAPATPTVTSLSSASAAPTISGTDTATGDTLTVNVGGATYDVTPNAGAWSLNLGTATPVSGSLLLSHGNTYTVTATVTDIAGNTASDTSSQQLAIIAVPTVTSLSSASTTPTIHGTDTDTDSSDTLAIHVGGATYDVTPSAGAWSLNLATATPVSGSLSLSAGNSYTVTAVVTDSESHTVSSTTSNQLAIIAVPTVATLSSASTTPIINGTDTDTDSSDTLTVNVGGATYDVTPSAGAWSLNLATATPVSGSLSLSAGNSYTVTATVTDSESHTVSSSTSNQLAIIAVPTVSTLSTASTTPTITGTDTDTDSSDTLTVTVGGATYDVTPSTGAWSLNLATATPVSGSLSLSAGNSYTVTATITDSESHTVSSTSTNQLTITASGPVPTTTVTTAELSDDTGSSSTDFITNVAAQTISGTLSANLAAGESVQVSYDGGTTWTNATSYTVGSSSWSTTTTLSGSNTFEARVTNSNGSSTAYTHSYDLDTTIPATPTVTSLSSASATPTISGTDTATGDTLTVSVGGATYDVTPNAGAWSLDLATATPVSGTLSLSHGSTYTVTATVTDIAGNTASDTSSQQLAIIAVPTVSSLSTGSTTPTITGTDTDTDGSDTLTVTVGGATYDVTPNAGTWSLNLATATPVSGSLSLSAGNSYTVTATVTDSESHTVSSTSTAQLTILTSAMFDFGYTDGGTVTGSGTDTVTDTVGSNELVVTGSTEPIVVGTVANIVDLSLTDVSQNAIVAESGDGALYYETQVTFSMGGTQAFNLNSFVVIDTGQGGGSVTLTTSKGSEVFNINTANDTIINLATAADASYFQGVTSITLTSPTNSTSGTPNGQFVFAFDDFAVTLNNTPSAPTVNTLSSASTTPTLSGTDTDTNSGDTLSVTVGGATYDVTPSSGTWSLDLATATPVSGSLSLSAGDTYTVTATITESNSTTVSSTSTDQLAIIAAPTVNFVSTASTTPTITGTDTDTDGSDTLTVTVGGATYDVTPSSGAWSLNLATATPVSGSLHLSAGSSYTVTATITDSESHTVSSTSSDQLTITGGSNGSGAPTITVTSAALSDDSGSSNTDFITNVAAQTISGTLSANLAAGEVVQVSYNDGATWSNATSYAVGSSSWSTTTTLSGSNTFEARVTNNAGSSAAYTHSYELDTATPATPTVTSLISTSTTPVITGSDTATGDALTVSIGGATYDVTPASGVWSLDLSTAIPVSGTLNLSAGHTYTVTATVTDIAGNTASSTGIDQLIITAAASAPTTTVVTAALSADTGSSNTDFITNVAAQTISGTLSANLAAGEVVQVSYDGGATWSTATNYAVGSSMWSATTILSGSNTFEARVTNSTSSSAAYTHSYDLDTTAPTTPTVTVLNSASTTPTINGTDTANGDTLTISVGGATYNVTPVNGTWSLDLATATPVSGVLSLSPGHSYTVVATVTDIAGNSTSDISSNQLTITETFIPKPPPVSGQVNSNPSLPIAQAIAPAFTVAAPILDFLPTDSVLTTAQVFTGKTTVNLTTVSSVNIVGDSDNMLTPPAGPGSYQAMVLPGNSDVLMANVPLNDIAVTGNANLSFQIPSDAFGDTNRDAVISLSATRADGTALPAWLHFNAISGKFTGHAPAGMHGEVDVRVIARDNQGHEAVQIFKIMVGGPTTRIQVHVDDHHGVVNPMPVLGRSSLSQQLLASRSHGADRLQALAHSLRTASGHA